MSFCEEGGYIYRLHFVTPGIPSKFTYDCTGFLEMCKSLEKPEALELRITLWHVGYMHTFQPCKVKKGKSCEQSERKNLSRGSGKF